MKDDVNFFIINPDGTLEINKIELRAIKEFRDIIVRDRGSEGDHEGRKKAVAFKELMFIHTYCHPGSIFRDLQTERRFESCKNNAGLPVDWVMDDVIVAACNKFIEGLNLSALTHSYLNANKGVYGVGEDLEFLNNRRTVLRKNIEKYTKQLDLVDPSQHPERILELEQMIGAATDTMLNIGTKVINISNSLPNSFKTLEELKERLAKESGAVNEIYGGGKLNNREA